MTEERLAELMVKVTDDLATASEREELMAHIARHPELQQELDMHMGLKATTDGWMERLEADLAEDRWRDSGVTQMWTWLGTTLFLLGIAILTGGGLVEVLMEPDVPIWVKLGYGGLMAGTLVLLAAATRWWWMTSKHDKYTEVVR